MSQKTDPPPDVIELLNRVSAGYVGLTKPKVNHIKEEPLSYTREHEAKLAEGDYLPVDEGF